MLSRREGGHDHSSGRRQRQVWRDETVRWGAGATTRISTVPNPVDRKGYLNSVELGPRSRNGQVSINQSGTSLNGLPAVCDRECPSAHNTTNRSLFVCLWHVSTRDHLRQKLRHWYRYLR